MSREAVSGCTAVMADSLVSLDSDLPNLGSKDLLWADVDLECALTKRICSIGSKRSALGFVSCATRLAHIARCSGFSATRGLMLAAAGVTLVAAKRRRWL
jgi:hypothetical protein